MISSDGMGIRVDFVISGHGHQKVLNKDHCLYCLSVYCSFRKHKNPQKGISYSAKESLIWDIGFIGKLTAV